MPSIDPFDYYERLGRVRTFVLDHLTEPLSLRAVAQVACVTPAYFSALFRRKVGMSFMTWLRHARVEEAARLLTERDWSIAHVAERVGFGSVRTFERAFRACLGHTPRAHRERHRPELVQDL